MVKREEVEQTVAYLLTFIGNPGLPEDTTDEFLELLGYRKFPIPWRKKKHIKHELQGRAADVLARWIYFRFRSPTYMPQPWEPTT